MSTDNIQSENQIIKYLVFRIDEKADATDLLLYRQILNRINKDVCSPNNFYSDHIEFYVSAPIITFNNIYFAVDENLKVVGFLIADEGVEKTLISYLCVDKSMRNKGIGKELLKSYMLTLNKNTVVRAEVNDTSALKYFLKHGFNFSGKSDCGNYLHMDNFL
jgi:ribosomal protein S18 acetylase RimI-like enzyme